MLEPKIIKYLIIGALLSVYSQLGFAYSFEFGDIDVPTGFEGPQHQNDGESLRVTAFVKPHGDGTSALLQVSIWDPGQEIQLSGRRELEQASAYYLLEFLSGHQRASIEFSHSEFEFVAVSNLVMAKTKWRGTKLNRDMHGIMYCFIHDSKIVILNTQDFVEYMGEFLSLAEHAFETIEQ